MLSGMTLFEAINYSMSAISTTGMDISTTGLTTTHNGWNAIGIHNYWTDISLILIMLLGATSFSVHYLFWKSKDLKSYFSDTEFKALIIIGLISAFSIIPKLGIESAIFHAISAITGGGFSIEMPLKIGEWESFSLIILSAAMFIGGSSASTAGGIKLNRFIIFIKSIHWKIMLTMLPKNSIISKKFEGQTVEETQIKEITQFIAFFALFIFLGTLILTFQGYPLDTATFEVVSAQSNVGISAGISNETIPLLSKTMLIFNMWIGRIEILPFFILLGLIASIFKTEKIKSRK